MAFPRCCCHRTPNAPPATRSSEAAELLVGEAMAEGARPPRRCCWVAARRRPKRLEAGSGSTPRSRPSSSSQRPRTPAPPQRARRVRRTNGTRRSRKDDDRREWDSRGSERSEESCECSVMSVVAALRLLRLFHCSRLLGRSVESVTHSLAFALPDERHAPRLSSPPKPPSLGGRTNLREQESRVRVVPH